MVASNMIGLQQSVRGDMGEYNGCSSKTEILNNWIQNFRCKKISMKRKRRGGGDLRVCAILTTALHSVEEELRRKQQERALKWSRLQSNFLGDRNNNNDNSEVCLRKSDLNTGGGGGISCERGYFTFSNSSEMDADRKRDIEDLWSSELNGLDNFINSLNQIKTAVVR